MDTTITLLQEGLELFGEICEEAPTESEEWQWRWRVRHLLEDAAAPATPDLLAKAADLLPVLVEEMDDARPTLADLKVIAGLMQVAHGGVYLVLGNDAADKRRGVRRLVMGGLLVLLFVLLFSLPACGPIDSSSTTQSVAASTVEPAMVQSMPVPGWAAYPVGQWLNMDWDLWSCPRARGC